MGLQRASGSAEGGGWQVMDIVERRIAEIAARQDNVITHTQLLHAGCHPRGIARRVEQGGLRVLHRGVYLAGYADPSRLARARAAVFACGPEAFACCRTAIACWDLGPPPRLPEVTVVGGNRRHPGITVHRTAAVHPDDIRILDGIPVSAPARAICEMACGASRSDVEHAVQEAIVRRILTEPQLRAAHSRRAGRPGAPLVRAILAAESGPGHTRSRAERALTAILREADLPRPEKNVVVHGQRVDMLWREQRLVVEVDGRGPHDTAIAFVADRRRDQVLVAHGYTVVRFTFAQLIEEPVRVTAVLSRALAR